MLINSSDKDTLLWEKREADWVWERDANYGIKSNPEDAVLLYLLVWLYPLVTRFTQKHLVGFTEGQVRLLVASLLKEASSSNSLLSTTMSLYFFLIFSRAVFSFHDLLPLNCCTAFAFSSLAVTASLNRNKFVYKIFKDFQRHIGPAEWAAPFPNTNFSSSKLLTLLSCVGLELPTRKLDCFLKQIEPQKPKSFAISAFGCDGQLLLTSVERFHYSEGKVTLTKSATPLLMFSLEI